MYQSLYNDDVFMFRILSARNPHQRHSVNDIQTATFLNSEMLQQSTQQAVFTHNDIKT